MSAVVAVLVLTIAARKRTFRMANTEPAGSRLQGLLDSFSTGTSSFLS